MGRSFPHCTGGTTEYRKVGHLLSHTARPWLSGFRTRQPGSSTVLLTTTLRWASHAASGVSATPCPTPVLPLVFHEPASASSAPLALLPLLAEWPWSRALGSDHLCCLQVPSSLVILPAIEIWSYCSSDIVLKRASTSSTLASVSSLLSLPPPPAPNIP